MKVRAVMVAAGMLAFAPGGAHAANSVIVPDHVPTLQAAFDSAYVGVYYDSIYVRAGVVTDTLIGWNLGYQFVVGLGDSSTRPSIGYMRVHIEDYVTFEDIDFTGTITTMDEAGFVFRRCRIGNLELPTGGSPRLAHLYDCDVTGGIYAGSDGHVWVDSSRFDDAGVAIAADASLTLTHSTFTGPGAYIASRSGSWGEIRGITMTHGGGIYAEYNNLVIADNVLEDCAVGVRIREGSGNLVARNTVRRCGVGFDVSGDVELLDNVVTDSEADGIRFKVTENGGRVERNVIARSTGHGVVLTRHELDYRDWIVVRNNTSYGNGGSGFRAALATAEGDEHVTHNIGWGNGAHGFASTGVADPVLACNDWFANDSSAVAGMPLAFEDFYLDPMFCDVAHDSVSLFAGSPLVDAMHCGLIGARGVGCEAASTPSPVAPRSLVLAPVTPNPSPGPVRFAWSLPREDWVEVTVHDLAGRTIAVVARGVFLPGAHSRIWDVAPSRSGVYFVRLRGAGTSTARSFLVRR